MTLVIHQSQARIDVDIAVLGGSPGGLASAIAAARLGRRVLIVETNGHVGGMMTSGLGKSDIEHREMIGGLFREFVGRVYQHYRGRYGADSQSVKLCRQGYYFEPSVAERVFEDMLAEHSEITILRGYQLSSASAERDTLRQAVVTELTTGKTLAISAEVFIDATYEGDLYAMAGAESRVGRESRAEWGEPHAGVIYLNYETQQLLPGSTGEADERLPAFTFRLCLSTEPNNHFVLRSPPNGYDRDRYLPYLDDLTAGRLSAPKRFVDGWGYYPEHFDTLMRALSVTDLPGSKVDANINPRPLAFPFAEENRGYVEGDFATRKAICKTHRDWTLGLLYFLQNDMDVPASHREMANQYHLPLDEFTDNGHFPYQLYVREARRLVGEYTLTEHDVAETGSGISGGRFDDAIAVGEFPVDSFPVRKWQPGDTVVLEGYLGMLDSITRIYQIPYRIMIPRKIDGLIVPVTASATHVAYSSIRMEPTWMAMGQAAGVAAHLSMLRTVTPRNISITDLQALLRQQGQIIEVPERPTEPLPQVTTP